MRGIRQHANVFPVFSRTAHHGGAADVDVLNRIRKRATGIGHGRFKRVQIDDQQVDGGNAVILQGCHMRGQIAPRQQAAMNLWVQGFDAAIQHFRKARVVGHFCDRQTVVSEQFGGAAGGQQLDAQRVQALGQFKKAGFVRDGEQGVHEFRI